MKITNVYGITSDLSMSAPESQVSDLGYVDGVLSWTPTGDHTLIIASSRRLTFLPLDGVTYPVGVLSSSAEIMYRGLGEEVDVSELDFTKDWYFYVFSFNGVQSVEKYNRELQYIFIPASFVEDGIFDDTFDFSFE